MLQEVYPDSIQQFAPLCYFSHLGPPGSILVFEDLKTQSFRLPERSLGLDMAQSLLVVRCLAKMHASSAILLDREPDLTQVFSQSAYKESSRKSLDDLFNYILRDLAEEVKRWPGYERYQPKILEIAENAADYILDGVTRDENDFNVLIHADAWTNNMLLQYSEQTGQSVDIRYVVDDTKCVYQDR